MIRVVTDSAADLDPAVAGAAGVTVVPLTIRFGDEDFVSGEDLSVDDFWRRLTESDVTPSTAAPSVGRFQGAFDALADDGATGIIVLPMSSKISATHRSAELAAGDWDRVPVRVADTGLVSAALGLTVLDAAAAASAGAGLAEVVARAADTASRSNLFAALDTLEFLKRGGRVGGARAMIGSLLDIKPLITFQDGEVAAAGRVRTRGKAVAAVVDHVAELANRLEAMSIVHSAPDRVDQFADRIAEVWTGSTTVTRLGPIVGTHGGPGVIGVTYRTTAEG